MLNHVKFTSPFSENQIVFQLMAIIIATKNLYTIECIILSHIYLNVPI